MGLVVTCELRRKVAVKATGGSVKHDTIDIAVLGRRGIAMRNKWIDGMMGVVVGDALGMPVQFVSREELRQNPVKTMEGYGTYNMPPGTWSDDSSMALATLVSIRENRGIDCNDIMERFVAWNLYGEYTPAGKSFDQGNTCMEAICNYMWKQDTTTCGKTGEWANGNGALMRIMPVCLYAYEKMNCGAWTEEEAMEQVQQVAALTHNHLRSHIACVMYCYMVRSILDETGTLRERLQKGVDDTMRYYHKDISTYVELAHYGRLFHLDEFATCKEENIKSTGYVVDSLEAALWSLLTTESLEEALLRAVNLGDDTDTVGAIAGGLAALYYRYESAPEEWRSRIIKPELFVAVCEEMEGWAGGV